jgi:hypothetical protein
VTELEQELVDTEDRIAVLERAVVEAACQARFARADVVEEQAVAVRAETQERQARINELQPQVEAMQAEIATHANWIRL